MIITQTPLRISLLGGITDFRDYYTKYNGAFITMAIDKYIYCIVKERFDDDIRITYSTKEIVKEVKDIKHDLVREAMKLVGIKNGIEIMFLSDVPSEGSGLGSSSAVTVGVLNALHRYKGENVSAEQLAKEACEIEIDILKRPIGIQDQYATAYGGLRIFQADAFSVASRVISPSDEFMRSLMLIYTDKQRSAGEILSKMDLDRDILDQNKALALQGISSIERGDIHQFADLLNKYWELKQRLNPKVTNRDINLMYKKAMANGALGGKIVGAGGGGFMLLITEGRRKLSHLGKELPFRIANDGSKVIFDIRR